jgi:hypothetical protein
LDAYQKTTNPKNAKKSFPLHHWLSYGQLPDFFPLHLTTTAPISDVAPIRTSTTATFGQQFFFLVQGGFHPQPTDTTKNKYRTSKLIYTYFLPSLAMYYYSPQKQSTQ